MCLCQVNKESNATHRTLTEVTSGICMSFRNKGGCSDIPDFREIINEEVFAGANKVYHIHVEQLNQHLGGQLQCHKYLL